MARANPHITLAQFARDQNDRALDSELRAAGRRNLFDRFDAAVGPGFVWLGGLAVSVVVIAGIVAWRALA